MGKCSPTMTEHIGYIISAMPRKLIRYQTLKIFGVHTSMRMGMFNV